MNKLLGICMFIFGFILGFNLYVHIIYPLL